MGGGGVIDREHLKHSLTRQSHPVYHFLQISKIAYAKTAFRFQGEDRHKSSGTSHRMAVKGDSIDIHHNDISLVHFRQYNLPIIRLFPSDSTIAHCHEFELKCVLWNIIHCHVNGPFTGRMCNSGNTMLWSPVAQQVAVSCQDKSLALA